MRDERTGRKGAVLFVFDMPEPGGGWHESDAIPARQGGIAWSVPTL